MFIYVSTFPCDYWEPTQILVGFIPATLEEELVFSLQFCRQTKRLHLYLFIYFLQLTSPIPSLQSKRVHVSFINCAKAADNNLEEYNLNAYHPVWSLASAIACLISNHGYLSPTLPSLLPQPPGLSAFSHIGIFIWTKFLLASRDILLIMVFCQQFCWLPISQKVLAHTASSLLDLLC